ncbi:MAG TPA: MopE-related protein, partial [Candidatus Binatia bacterium]|nr:MopE-related protein [Candidatus Binatia bacterium]
IIAASGDANAVTVLQAPAAAAVAGQRRAIVLVVDFLQDGKTVACSDAAIAGAMFTGDPSVDRLYQAASFGQVSWPGDSDGNGAPDVFRVAIADGGSDCATDSWRAQADAAASAAGVNLSLYQHRLYVLPSTVGCTWAGLGLVGCSSSCWAIVATCDRGDVYAHELGHNVGLNHASFDADNDGQVDPTCPWGAWSGGGEYCDDSDFMGISTNVWRMVNGAHESQMGWLPASRVVDAASGQSYTLAALETVPANPALPQLVRIAKPDTGSTYYVSYRRRLGYDANMRSSYADRTSIHTLRGSGNTLLVAFLADGQSFQDPTNGIIVTQVAHDAAAATIQVSLACGNGVLDPGEECDGANLGGATCGGCAGQPRCTTGCRIDLGGCTNGVCDATETCAGCAADCVRPGAVCGDGICQAGNGESCVSCPADCNGQQSGKPNGRFCCGFSGANPVGCDASRCGACTTANVSVCCGDGQCSGGETGATCGRDCGACADADGDGVCANQGDCNDADPAVRPGATEQCTGGRDEDCDALVDCNDPGCATSAACTSCLPAGAGCTTSSACCSGSCGGKPNRKTCR